MNLIEKYLTSIEKSPRRTKLYIGKDALFLVFRYVETAIDLKRRPEKRKKHRVTVILLLTLHGVQRIEPIHQNYQKHVDDLAAKLEWGSIDSQSSLLGAMGKYRTTHGPLRLKLNPTRLEYYL